MTIGGYDVNITSGVDHDLWIRLLCKNPRIVVIWGDYIETTINTTGRMTTNEVKRKTGIHNSLLTWKRPIVADIRMKFYKHLVKQYSLYLEYKFVLYDIKNKQWLSSLKRLKKRGCFFIS